MLKFLQEEGSNCKRPASSEDIRENAESLQPLHANSVGNQATFASQKRRKPEPQARKASSAIDDEEFKCCEGGINCCFNKRAAHFGEYCQPTTTSGDTITSATVTPEYLISSLANCCNAGACLLKLFKRQHKTEYDAARYVNRCRSMGVTEVNGKAFRDQFLISTFISMITDDKEEGGKRIFKMAYKIPPLSFQYGACYKIEVCKMTALFTYGFTKHEWEKTSRDLKEVDPGKQLGTVHHQKWTDKTLHPITYAETEQIFQKNLGQRTVGEYARVAKLRTYVYIYSIYCVL